MLLIVKPETVVGWHRAGFRRYWRWLSPSRGGRPRITEEIRILIRRLAQENTDWGAPKIHGELRKLGLVISERTIARYLRSIRRRGDPGKKWLAFLRNRREAIVAFDFFSVPTATFRVLYCFFVIEHGRRRILHFNVTPNPSAEWVVQQLREAFPEAGPYRYVILDRDSIFNADVIAFLQATGLKPKRTSIQAPWQNGTAEKWIGSCRREILDHLIALNEEHLRRIIRLRPLLPRRPHSRFPGKGHSESTTGRAKTAPGSDDNFLTASGRPATSIRLAASGIGTPAATDPLCPLARLNLNQARFPATLLSVKPKDRAAVGQPGGVPNIGPRLPLPHPRGCRIRL